MNNIPHDHISQPPIAMLPPRLWDVVIVGAGPAGSMAAYHLARKGYGVLLLDRHRFPRDKVCGDALIPDAIHCLQRAGVYDRIRAIGTPFSTLRIYSPSRHAIDIPSEFLTLKRIILDEKLVEEAVGQGTIFACGRVHRLFTNASDGVSLACAGESSSIHARVVVLATGADVSLLQKLDMVEQPRASAIALRCYIRSSLNLDRIVTSFDRSIIPGYAWIFPMGNNEYNTGCGIYYRGDERDHVNLRSMFSMFLNEFPLAKKLMSAGEMISPIKGARLRCGLTGTRTVHDGRFLAIGETIGTTFPFTGEGIGKAMETGELAASVIHQAFSSGTPMQISKFHSHLEKILRPRYTGYRIAKDWLAHGWLNDLMIRRAQKSAYLRNTVKDILTETAVPQEVFSMRGLLKSLWK